MKKKWTKSRCTELELLRQLLIDVSTMNHGSSVVDRILRCEKIANKLNQTNLAMGRASFHQFLVGLAAEERRPKATAASGKSGGTGAR